MTDPLTGYELSSIEKIDAGIDDLGGSPTAVDIYELSLPHSERALGAVAAKRAGSGGGGGGGIVPDVQVFDTAGAHTWTKPAGATLVQVLVQDGGNGGTAGDTTAGGAGPGVGGSDSHGGLSNPIPAASLPATVACTVGAGGAGGVAPAGAGSAGGASSFGVYVNSASGYVHGGGGGSSGGDGSAGDAAGTDGRPGTGFYADFEVAAGGAGGAAGTHAGAPGTASPVGAAGGGGGGGGGGKQVGAGGAGGAGASTGGGGGGGGTGSTAGGAGGAGGDGLVVVMAW